MQEILCYGSRYITKIKDKVSNQFWKDVLEAFASFTREFLPNTTEIMSESLWFSDYTKFRCSVIRNWHLKGIRFIIDLFNENTGLLHTKESLQQAYGIKMTFLCYSSLIRSLPSSIKCAPITKTHGPTIPTRLNLALNHPNFTRFAYNQFVKHRKKKTEVSNLRQKQKWLGDIGCFDTNSFVEVVKATKSSYIRMFQYRIVNRIITTNKYLHIINIIDNELCTFCNVEPETLAHLFWFCPRTKEFITTMKTKLIKYNIKLNLDPTAWFFPTNMCTRDTCIITLAKITIYRSRCNNSIPNTTHLMNIIKQEVENECKIAERIGKRNNFEEKWGTLRNIVT